MFRELSFAIDDLSPAEARTLYEKGLKRDVWKDVRLGFPRSLEDVVTFAEEIDAVSSGMASPRLVLQCVPLPQLQVPPVGGSLPEEVQFGPRRPD